MATKGEATRERLTAAAEELILKKGYSGTSLDDVLAETGLTKGAFFHHFRSKADLARAVVERYAETDGALFAEWSARADRLSEDPLERVLIFLRLFEEHLDGLGRPFPGCVFAAYTYAREEFEPDIHACIREGFAGWMRLYEDKLAALIAARPPAAPVTARGLAEMIVTIVEGGFVLALALDDAGWLQRQSAEYRRYLELLFRPPGAEGRPARAGRP